jgi:hypothetical protein
MEEQDINPLPVTKKRPEFLTLLCVLSFIGIGFSFFDSLVKIFLQTSSNLIKLLNQINSVFGNIIDNQGEYIQTQHIIGFIAIIAALICLAGVIMMCKLHKTGYFIYILGEIAPPIAVILLAGYSGFNGIYASVYMISLMISFIFPIAFIIMYGLNLKHMK